MFLAQLQMSFTHVKCMLIMMFSSACFDRFQFHALVFNLRSIIKFVVSCKYILNFTKKTNKSAFLTVRKIYKYQNNNNAYEKWRFTLLTLLTAVLVNGVNLPRTCVGNSRVRRSWFVLLCYSVSTDSIFFFFKQIWFSNHLIATIDVRETTARVLRVYIYIYTYVRVKRREKTPFLEGFVPRFLPIRRGAASASLLHGAIRRPYDNNVIRSAPPPSHDNSIIILDEWQCAFPGTPRLGISEPIRDGDGGYVGGWQVNCAPLPFRP